MKHKQIYIDKNGNSFEPSSAKVKIVERHQTYVMILKGDEILCIYDREAEIYTLPKLEDVQNLEINPNSSFKTIAYIKEKNRYYKEIQTFNVYELINGNIHGNILQWCKTEDILIRKIDFDETVFTGFKKFYVR